MINSVELGWVYRYCAGAGSPAGEILNPHPHLHPHIANTGAPVSQNLDPHPHLSGPKSAGTRNCHPYVWIHELFFSPPRNSPKQLKGSQTRGLFFDYLQIAYPKKNIPQRVLFGATSCRAY